MAGELKVTGGVEENTMGKPPTTHTHENTHTNHTHTRRHTHTPYRSEGKVMASVRLLPAFNENTRPFPCNSVCMVPEQEVTFSTE
jgi:hypothetical protein